MLIHYNSKHLVQGKLCLIHCCNVTWLPDMSVCTPSSAQHAELGIVSLWTFPGARVQQKWHAYMVLHTASKSVHHARRV